MELNSQKSHLVKLSEIVVLEGRGRQKFEDIKTLAMSIKERGLISPICVNDVDMSLVAGERRLRAMKMLPMLWEPEDDLKPLDHPARVIMQGYAPVNWRSELNKAELKEIELEENLYRQQLEWPEELAIRNQIHEHKKLLNPHHTLEDTASALGEDRSSLNKKITFHKKLEEAKKLDPEIVNRLRSLPLSAAVKEFERIEVAKDTERRASAGLITLSNQIVHGDCVEVLKTLKENSFDCSIADMPFGIPELAESIGESKSGGSTTYTARLLPDDNLDARGAIELARRWAPELFRVLKPSAHAYTFFSFEIFDALKAAFRDAGFVVTDVPIIWNKKRMTSTFKGYEPAPMYEPILLAHKPPRSRRLNEPCGMVWDISPLPETSGKIHPFQKPEELLSKILKLSTNPGDKVVDCFAGSGSTVCVAQRLGRSGFGIEKSKERYMQAQNGLLAEGMRVA